MTSRDTGVPFAIVHHANQYLITNGYTNRQGIADIVGPSDASSGLRAVMELHARYDIPFHLHISGTFIEACAWFDPDFLNEIVEFRQSGLVEVIGSAYSQNIMPLFSKQYNWHQVQEELRLLEKWLKVQPSEVTGFWVPERVWNTRKLARVLTDPTLLNGGFHYILVDDRLLLPQTVRQSFDHNRFLHPELFKAHLIKGGKGLIALPLSTEIRVNVPFETDQHEGNLTALICKLVRQMQDGHDVIAVYGDDMEKAAGIPPMWNERAIDHYQRFLQWLINNQEIRPILLQNWLVKANSHPPYTVGTGTYMELATQFGAGEDYRGWAGSSAWEPYQRIINQAWRKLNSLCLEKEKETTLLHLARKHILACSYETAWHDPKINGSSVNWQNAAPAPWARALASHARTAFLLMEAVQWADDSTPGHLHAYTKDLDNDGHEEVVLRNDLFAVVVTPRFGGRIIYAFSLEEKDGALVIGNPLDDWNLLEEINDFMDVPMNHPGALADYGFEHDAYAIVTCSVEADEAELVMVNKQENSLGNGLVKRLSIRKGERKIQVRYEQIPHHMLPLSLDVGLSPDYVKLLQEGRAGIAPCQDGDKRGFRTDSVFVWVSPECNAHGRISRSPLFGHGCCLALTLTASSGSFTLGVDTNV